VPDTSASATLRAQLVPPPGVALVPPYRGGWLAANGPPAAYLDYLVGDEAFNWSDDLEALHTSPGSDHFIDTWTRRAVLDGLDLGRIDRPSVVDIGCSSGELLCDLVVEHPAAALLGVDVVPSGLAIAHALTPTVPLLRASALALPLPDDSIDAIASLNVLEHLADDVGALAEMNRVLRPGGRAAIVVPAGPGLYDFYDRHLKHQRRYGRGELRCKAESVGLRVLLDAYLGGTLYPAFWFIKKRNRWVERSVTPERERELVARQIAGTRDSRIGRLLCRCEHRAARAGLRVPIGIRSIGVLESR
jgi:SAM-dependent methyltransferase